VTIRPEAPGDEDAIRALHRAAFAPSQEEAEIVDRLRATGDLVLSLIATDGDAIVGHVALSTAHVDSHEALGLGPIGVDPAHQRRGIGKALMEEAIGRASQTEYPLIALLGHPGYYPRFGFQPAEAMYGITTAYEVPPEAWMALALPAYTPHVRGRFRYSEAFG
jgi:putative acetyltransferase